VFELLESSRVVFVSARVGLKAAYVISDHIPVWESYVVPITKKAS